MNGRCVGVMVGPPTPSLIVNEARHEAVHFSGGLNFYDSTLTDAPAEEIVPRDASKRARAIVCMKNRRDVP